MEKSNLEYLLALWLTPGFGPGLQKTVIEQYPNLQEFFELDTNLLKGIGFKPELINAIHNPKWPEVDKMLAWSEQKQHHLILYNSKDYPAPLKEITTAPTVLMAHGNKNLLNYSQLAIIGSRNPTQAGLETAHNYARALSDQGLVITSGMALGIDAAAHMGAISQTIAVLGTGVDMLYPKRHEKLARDISETGLLLSEFPLGMTAHANHFPRRNRIISGLSLGIFVVEAALRSGSLITARFGLEQGREIFTMPSSIHNPMAKGCHRLLKQGANLVESTHDIWEQLTQHPLKLLHKTPKTISNLDISSINPHVTKPEVKLTAQQQQLLRAIGFDRINANALMKRTRLSAEQISRELLELEILGRIETVPGGLQRTKAS